MLDDVEGSGPEGGLLGRLGEVLAATERVEAESERIVGRLGALEDDVVAAYELLAAQPTGGPWSWRDLDPYERQALLVEVREWVDWITARLDASRRTVYPCWYRHPVMVEEMIALYVAWRAAYGPRKPGAYSTDLAAWMDRWWWVMERTLRLQHMPGCATGRHESQPQSKEARTDGRAFTAHTDEMLAGLDEPMTLEAGAALVEAGRADRLGKDADSPIRDESGRWWAVLYNSPDGRLVPRGGDEAELLEAQWVETQAKKPGRVAMEEPPMDEPPPLEDQEPDEEQR